MEKYSYAMIFGIMRLVELLVVIAIVAVLLAMLMGTLKRTQEMAVAAVGRRREYLCQVKNKAKKVLR